MKRINFYLSMLLLLGIATGCNDDFDQPPMVVPTAEHTANMTIADFKAKYWQDATNYIDTVKEEIYISGYVSSSDASGNIYKSLYIQDETGGLAISINGTSLNSTYRLGQQLVISAKDLFVGKYNGQQQMGYPAWYEKGKVWEATFLPLELWEQHVEINGLPNVDKVNPVTCKISDFQGKTDKDTKLKWCGQLVRLQNVHFEDADGTTTYSNSDKSTNRNIVDSEGNTLIMRNSNYASFKEDILPLGNGDIIGLLSFYGNDNTGVWQLYIRDTDDVIGFSTSTKGTMNDPYTVDEAVELQNSSYSGWMSGYIVGAVAPEVTTVSSNADIEWTAPTTLNNTLVIGQTPDTKDLAHCVIVALPDGTPFRTQANLKDNPGLYQSLIYVKGTFGTYMGTNGILDNSGSTDEFKLTVVVGGLTTLNEGFEDGNIPDGWTNLQVSGDKKWYVTSFNNNHYAAMTGYKGTQPPFDVWLITPALNIAEAASKILTFRTQVNGYGSTTSRFEVYVLSSDDPSSATTKVQLNPTIATAPASGYSDWAASGSLDLSAYNGTYFIGFRFYAESDANYATWCVDDVQFNVNGGTTEPTQPSETSATRADLETLNDGTPTGYYGTYTTTAGWTATNCNVLQGGAEDSNPVFKFIGYVTGSTSDYAMAAGLNGKTSSVGTLVSPTITGGCSKLRFSYGLAFTDSAIKFQVDVKQNGSTVKTFTVEQTSPVKQQVYNFEESVDVTGDFTLEFTNLCPSALDKNKDRVAIWNINWDN